MTLKELQIGKSAVVDTVGGSGELRHHLLDMGLTPGRRSPAQSHRWATPSRVRMHGYELTLRLDDAAKIEVETASTRRTAAARSEERHTR